MNMLSPSGWTADEILKGALNFDGVDDYVSTPFNPALNNLGQIFTIESWINPHEAGDYRGAWGSHGTSTKYTGIVLQYSSSIDAWGAWFGDGTTWNGINLGKLPLDKWTHVAIVFQASTIGSGPGYLKAYVNGSNIAVTTVPNLSVLHETVFSIGRGRDEANRYFKGKIDDVKIFNYALLGRDIVGDYQRGLLFCTGDMRDYPHATVYTNDKNGLTLNTTYSYSSTDTDKKCEFYCDDYFDWNGVQCVPAVCIGTTPLNSTVYDILGANLKPKKNFPYVHSASDTPAPCEFGCNISYEAWDGANCNGPVCTGTLPENASPHTGDTVLTGFTANQPYVYSATNTTAKCEYACKNGYVWDGATHTCKTPVTSDSCWSILKEGYSTGDGVYWVNLPTIGATQVYCLMNTAYDGGGWMMAMKATRGTTFNYNSTYWTADNTLNSTAVNQNDGDAKFEVMNKFAAKDMLARWPDIGAGGSIGGLGNWTWLQNNFKGGARSTLTDFFNTAGTFTNGYGGYFIQDAKTYSGWASGTFSSQADIRFYGFNFSNSKAYGFNANVRWGFGWNENSEGLYNSPTTLSSGWAPGSDDVSGGIGMDSTYGNYSAGDRVNCCQDTTGINRSARVEIYVR